MSWIDTLPLETRSAIKSAMQPRIFARGALIFNRAESPEGLFVIDQGTASFFVDSETGNRLLLRIIRPGEIIGETVALDGRPAPISVEARSDLNTRFVPAARLTRLRRTHRAIEAALAIAASGNLRRLLTALEELVLMPLPQRTLSRLRQLVRESTTAGWREDGLLLDLRQAELAEMLGVSRQAINTVLGSFQRQGLLERRFGHILCKRALLH